MSNKDLATLVGRQEKIEEVKKATTVPTTFCNKVKTRAAEITIANNTRFIAFSFGPSQRSFRPDPAINIPGFSDRLRWPKKNNKNLIFFQVERGFDQAERSC
jgi:hypothetical protein